jgi:hypothetical protein
MPANTIRKTGLKQMKPTGVLGLFLFLAAFLFLTPSLSLSEHIHGENLDIDKAFQHLYEVMDKNGVSFDRPRFIASYEILSPELTPDNKLATTCFIYDNALALMAFLARGTAEDMGRARILADAFVYAQNHDRFFTDGRLRNAYRSGAFIDGYNKKALLPGWYDNRLRQWCEDKEQVGATTGNMAWVGLALLAYHEKAGGKPYLDTALKLGEWIEKETGSDRGYTGGVVGWEPAPEKMTWRSTEHHIDLMAFFLRLFEKTGYPRWKKRAALAKRFITAMWNEKETHFWTGTVPGGVRINPHPLPLDIQAWAIAAMPGERRYRKALIWCEKNGYTEADGFKGFDYDTDRDGVWFEGTAQMALAYQITGETDKAARLMAALEKAQATAPNANGKGLVAASHDGLTTGFEWKYYTRLHIGATAWLIFARMRYNPLETQHDDTL